MFLIYVWSGINCPFEDIMSIILVPTHHSGKVGKLFLVILLSPNIERKSKADGSIFMRFYLQVSNEVYIWYRIEFLNF